MNVETTFSTNDEKAICSSRTMVPGTDYRRLSGEENWSAEPPSEGTTKPGAGVGTSR